MFRSLTNRLTAWYAGLLVFLALTVFIVFYISLSMQLLNRVDTELIDDAKEFADVINDKGTYQLQDLAEEELSPDSMGNEFILISNTSGNIFATTDLSSWRGLDEKLQAMVKGNADEVVLKSISIQDKEFKVRVISKRMADDILIQIGVSQEEDEELLSGLMKIFFVVTSLIVLLGGLFGWFMARRALSGVERVTETAMKIGEGNLAHRVAVRNEGLEIERLANSFNSMLDTINKLINELHEVTQNIAHDLRIPLTRIRGICETTLRTNSSEEEYRDMTVGVIEEVDRLVHIINVLLEIAENDSGVLQIAQEPIDMLDLIYDIVDLYSPIVSEKNITVTVESSSANVTVVGDSARLSRVFVNILDNAIKYTPSGGNILFSTKVEDNKVLISIKDSGIGMDKETADRIFDRFFRAEEARSTPGNGLGLSLAKAFVQAHGGEIRAESISEKGTEILITLQQAPV